MANIPQDLKIPKGKWTYLEAQFWENGSCICRF